MLQAGLTGEPVRLNHCGHVLLFLFPAATAWPDRGPCVAEPDLRRGHQPSGALVGQSCNWPGYFPDGSAGFRGKACATDARTEVGSRVGKDRQQAPRVRAREGRIAWE